jgi:hypothetical protein
MRSSGEGVGSAKMTGTEVLLDGPTIAVRSPAGARRDGVPGAPAQVGPPGLRQRAQILLASMVYTPVYQIALICQTDEAHVRRVIHAFNEGVWSCGCT